MNLVQTAKFVIHGRRSSLQSVAKYGGCFEKGGKAPTPVMPPDKGFADTAKDSYYPTA